MSFSVDQILEWTGGRLANADRLHGHASEIRVDRPAELGSSVEDELARFDGELIIAPPGTTTAPGTFQTWNTGPVLVPMMPVKRNLPRSPSSLLSGPVRRSERPLISGATRSHTT